MPFLIATSAFGIRKKTLEFSSAVLSTLSPYLKRHINSSEDTLIYIFEF